MPMFTPPCHTNGSTMSNHNASGRSADQTPSIISNNPRENQELDFCNRTEAGVGFDMSREFACPFLVQPCSNGWARVSMNSPAVGYRVESVNAATIPLIMGRMKNEDSGIT